MIADPTKRSTQGPRATIGAADALVSGAERAGIDTCVYVPDSCFTGVIRKFEASNQILMVPCAREDEGIAIATGLYLGGRSPVCLMEGSGLGYSALILARAIVQRTPVLVVASHTLGPGEPYDYHGATRLAAEGVFKGLGIPYAVASDAGSLPDLVHRSVQTVHAQLTCFGLLIPPYLVRGET